MSKAAYVFDGATGTWEPFSGPAGVPGPGLRILGSVAALVDLPPTGKPGEGWIVQDTGNLALWDQVTNQWSDAGRIKGEKGESGETLKISGAVPTAADLPPTPSPLTVYISQDNSSLYIYDVNSAGAGVNAPAGWVNLGAIAGPKGEKGDQGIVGPKGADAIIKGSVATVADLPAVGAAGEIRVVEKTGHLYSWEDINQRWIDGGKIRVDGKAAFFGAAVPDQTSLPFPGEPGEARITEDTMRIYSWNAGTQKWDEAGVLKSVPDGTTAGQTLVWDGAAWQPSDPLPAGTNEGDLLYWDSTLLKWIVHRSHIGYQDNLTVDPAVADGGSIVYDLTSDTWTTRKIKVGDLGDGPGTDVPANGDVLGFSTAQNRWVPTSVSNLVLGWQARAYPTGSLVFHDGEVWRASRDAFATEQPGVPVTSGAGDAWKVVGPEHLGEVPDVNTAAAVNGDLLVYDGSNWNATPPDFARQAHVNLRIDQLGVGVAKTTSVVAITNTPPAPTSTSFYIVGTSPTGDWTGEDNKIAYWSPDASGAYVWHFHAPSLNETHFVEAEAKVYTFNGTSWVHGAVSTLNSVPDGTKDGEVLVWSTALSRWEPKTPPSATAASSGAVVGTIVPSVLNETQFITAAGTEATKWRLCDGRSAAGTTYATLTGKTSVPDLRGAYFRMSGNNSTNPAWKGGTLLEWQEDSTARPKSAFRTNHTGNHRHTMEKMMGGNSGEWKSSNIGSANGNKEWLHTDYQGNHSHSITDGGDAETRPKTFNVNYFMYVG